MPMSEPESSPLRMPPVESLPGGDASIEDFIRFTREFDPTAHFQERWAARYKQEVAALRDRCVQSYRAGKPADGSAAELLMCMTHDCILGPYLGVPGSHKVEFLRWLAEGIRRSLAPGR